MEKFHAAATGLHWKMVTNTPETGKSDSKTCHTTLTCEPEADDDESRTVHGEPEPSVLNEAQIGRDDGNLGRSDGACVQDLTDVQVLL
jgi:hypothetical protein